MGGQGHHLVPGGEFGQGHPMQEDESSCFGWGHAILAGPGALEFIHHLKDVRNKQQDCKELK